MKTSLRSGFGSSTHGVADLSWEPLIEQGKPVLERRSAIAQNGCGMQLTPVEVLAVAQIATVIATAPL